jgi:6-phosphogluconolactonase
MASKLRTVLRYSGMTAIVAFISGFAAVAQAGTFVYVSNQDDSDISVYSMAPETGLLSPGPRAPAAKLVMPMASSPDGRFLYAAIRTKPYSIFNYRIEAATGELRWVGTSPMPESMVNVTVDRSGRWLLAASYGGDALSVSAIGPDGRVAGEPSQFFQTGGIKPHSIRVDLDNLFAYVPHLGSDELRIYRFDASVGKLTPAGPSSVKVKAGTGPRHFIISKDNRFIYLLGELTGVVTVFVRDVVTGGIEQIQTIDSVAPNSGLAPTGQPRAPAGTPGAVPFDESVAIWAADIQITPSGRFLFTTERTHSTISSFEVDARSGQLRYIGSVPTEKQPRGIGVDPRGRYLVASGEKSPNLSVYAIDANTGALTLKQQVPAGSGANWVQFVETK